MKKIFYTGLLMLLTGPWCYSQGFGIGTTTPDPRAILELKSANQALLLIYATKDNHVYLHNGTAWMQLCYGNGGTGGGTTGGIGSITNCPGTVSGTLAPGVAAGNVTITFNYTGGNGGSYATMSVASTGVTGLTARLAAGNLANGNGSLVFSVTGTPAAGGTAAFPITRGGQR